MDEIVFPKAETVFYAVLFVAAGAAGIARCWRDANPLRYSVICGRAISAGFFGAGTVALWLGPTASRIVDHGAGVFYWVAVASLVGYASPDIQDKLIANVLKKLFGAYLGPEDDRPRGPDGGGPVEPNPVELPSKPE